MSGQQLRTVKIGSIEHLTHQHPMVLGARTLCGIWIAGTPVSPRTTGACSDCQAAAEAESAEAGRLEGEYQRERPWPGATRADVGDFFG